MGRTLSACSHELNCSVMYTHATRSTWYKKHMQNEGKMYDLKCHTFHGKMYVPWTLCSVFVNSKTISWLTLQETWDCLEWLRLKNLHLKKGVSLAFQAQLSDDSLSCLIIEHVVSAAHLELSIIPQPDEKGAPLWTWPHPFSLRAHSKMSTSLVWLSLY